MRQPSYDLAVTGGGLAGLSAAILVAKAGFRVVLFEKEEYPFHRVCGEYISNESRNFLQELGVPLRNWNLPGIHTLQVTAADGTEVHHNLELGGFGISRFLLDQTLAEIAEKNGVVLMEHTRVTDVIKQEHGFRILTSRGDFHSALALGTFGKRSSLDVKWARSFAVQSKKSARNYMGVKYHLETDLPRDQISLHNFQGGYCGVSAIEENRYCCCYMVEAGMLRKAGNRIPDLEKQVLYRNPYLKNLFENARFLWQQPLTISQISFAPKPLFENQVWMCGDAAGMIPPLCGNGMSMALHGSKLAAEAMIPYFRKESTLSDAAAQYQTLWNRFFKTRLRTGRLLQQCFGHNLPTSLFLRMIRPFPGIVGYLERHTHGNTF